MRISISIKIIVSFLVLSFASIFAIGKFSYDKTKDALINRTFDQLISVRTEKEKRLNDFFKQCSNDITSIASLQETKDILIKINQNKIDSTGSSEIISNYLLGYLQANNRYNKIIIIDSDTNIFTYSLLNRSEKGTNISLYLSFYNELKNNTNPYIKEISRENNHSIFIGNKLYEEKNNITGIVILEISYQPIDEIMFEDDLQNGLGQTGEIYLVGDDYLMRSSSRFIVNSKFETQVKTQAVTKAFNNEPGEDIFKDYRGIKVFSSYKKLDNEHLNWVILSEIDKFEAMETVNSVQNSIVYLSIIISLLLLGFVAAITANITAPIRKLQAETEKIYSGQYGQIINIHYNNEVGDLITAFNKMSVKLKEQAEKLEYEQVIRSSYSIDGQEAERQRLSRELHDGLAQYILAIKLKLEYASTLEGEKQKEVLDEAKNLFSDTIKEIRNISNNLMPAVLSQYGIVKAVENLAISINNDTKLNFSFKNNLKNGFLNKKTEIYIYRIIQEALNNTIKHSEAQNFDVEFLETETCILINIYDNGKGFDFQNKHLKSGNGLANIKERVSLLSGKISIISEPDKGFSINITIPI